MRSPRPAGLRLSAILLLALTLRVVFFSGYPGTDDTHYIEAAYRISIGDTSAFDSHFAVRTGLVLPTAAAFAVAGVSPATTTWLPFASSILAVVAAFLLGRLVYDVPVGLLSALLVSFLPLDVIFASQLFACAPVGLLAGVTAFCLVRARSSTRPWWMLLAGVTLGMSTLCADVAWFLLLPVAYYIAAHRPPARHVFTLIAGLALVVGLEAAYFAVSVGNPWHRWHVLGRAVAVQGSDALSSGTGVAYFAQPFLRLFSEQEFGLFPLLAVPVVLRSLFRPDSRDARFLAVWVVAVFLYMSYGTTSPFRFAPLPRLPRYLSTVTIPALVLLAAWLRTWRPVPRGLAIAGLAVSSVLCVWVDNGRAVKAPQRALASFVESHRGDAFVLEPALLFDVLYFRGFRPRTGLSALAADPAMERDLERLGAVCGGAAPVRSLRDVRQAYVGRRSSGPDAPLEGRPDATLVATFAPPDRFYYRLLRHPLFMAVFGVVRDRHRVGGLRELSTERVELYYLP